MTSRFPRLPGAGDSLVPPSGQGAEAEVRRHATAVNGNARAERGRSGRFDGSIYRRVTEPYETMVGVEPIPATANGRTRGASWGLPIGLFTGGGVMGLVCFVASVPYA